MQKIFLISNIFKQLDIKTSRTFFLMCILELPGVFSLFVRKQPKTKSNCSLKKGKQRVYQGTGRQCIEDEGRNKVFGISRRCRQKVCFSERVTAHLHWVKTYYANVEATATCIICWINHKFPIHKESNSYTFCIDANMEKDHE